MANLCRSSDPAGARFATVFQAAGLFAGVTAGVVLLACVNPEQLDHWPRLCLWSRLLGAPCPACGTTHALCALIHGDPALACSYNRNVLLVAPLLICIWLRQLPVLCRSLIHAAPWFKRR